MIKNRTSFFIRLARQDSLKNNLLSVILAKNPNVDISKRENFFDNISRFYSIHKLEERSSLKDENISDSNSIETWTNSDLRIKSIKLKSLRGFPKSEIPFGIDFTNESGEVSSMIILGGNATGKSSIYDAIEYNYCKRVGEAELRSSDFFEDEDEKFKDFLRNYNNPFNESFCEIQTNDEAKIFFLDKPNIPKNVRKKINPNSHFISDFDIYQYGKLDYLSNGKDTFQNIIATNVGLSEFLEIEKQLYSFSSYKRLIESNKFNGLNKEIENAKKGIENNKKSIEEKEAQLKNFQSNISVPNLAVKLKVITDLLHQQKNTSFSLEFDYRSFKQQIELFNKYYSQYVTLAIKSGSLQEIQFLETGLNLLENLTDCPMCNNSKSTKDEITQHVADRISQIKNLNELSRNINNAGNSLVEFFYQLTSGIIGIRAKNQQEVAKIQDKTEFNELLKESNDFDLLLGNITSNDFFNDIKGIEDNAKYLKDKVGYLNFILERNADFIQDDLTKYVVEIQHYVQKRNDLLSKIEAELKAKNNTTSIEGQIAILNNEVEILKKQIEQFEIEIQKKDPELVKAKENLDLYNRIKFEANEYYKVFHSELARETQQAFEPIKDIVLSVLGEYLYEEERPVDLIVETKIDEVDEETGEVISEIITAFIKERNTNNPPISINKYFNTFHFRLFCTMAGISIAVASRKNTGINLPLVLDDVFYASDFENRSTVERFIKKLFDLFKKHTENIPLQLVLFTHDQQIFESTIKVVNEIQGKNIAFAKLFQYSEARNEGGYLNLVYKFPDYFPNTIMNNLYSEV